MFLIGIDVLPAVVLRVFLLWILALIDFQYGWHINRSAGQLNADFEDLRQ